MPFTFGKILFRFPREVLTPAPKDQLGICPALRSDRSLRRSYPSEIKEIGSLDVMDHAGAATSSVNIGAALLLRCMSQHVPHNGPSWSRAAPNWRYPATRSPVSHAGQGAVPISLPVRRSRDRQKSC
jgi:hypothetical protein